MSQKKDKEYAYVIPTMQEYDILPYCADKYECELLKDYFRSIDYEVTKILHHHALPPIGFIMPPQSVKDILSWIQEARAGEYPVFAHYCAAEGEYIYQISCDIELELWGRFLVKADVCRLHMEGPLIEEVEVYSRKFQDWKGDPVKSRLFAINEYGEPDEIAFLDAYSVHEKMNVFRLGKPALALLGNSQPMLDLYRRLHNCSIFVFEDDPKTKKTVPILVPHADNAHLAGSAVFWEEGSYHIIHTISTQDDWAALDANNEEYHLQEEFREYKREILKTADVKRAAAILRPMWSSPSNTEERTTFVFPLSESACSLSINPYGGEFESFVVRQKRKLTKEENKNLNAIKKFFTRNQN